MASKFINNMKANEHLKKYIIIGIGGLIGTGAYVFRAAPVNNGNIENQFNRYQTNLSINEGEKYKNAIENSKQILKKIKEEFGAPGIVVGVSVDGVTIWEEGLGLADVEQNVRCKPHTVMRIASISKSITAALAAKLWEQGKLDLDRPIQHYVPHWPDKYFQDKKVEITSRQLASHTGGIRHYNKEPPGDQRIEHSQLTEYLSKERFNSVKEALELFKDDPIMCEPGSKYLYSTHGFTLLSAVLEGAAGEPITAQYKWLFQQLGLRNTSLDHPDNLIYHRARFYLRNSAGQLVNSPYVDNSSKWAGGGLLSTVGDLLRFGNAMLYSYQALPTNPAGFFKPSTVEKFWSPVENTYHKKVDAHYGLGWHVFLPDDPPCAFCRNRELYVSHTGAAVGASSVLLILPCDSSHKTTHHWSSIPPHGIVVSIITNMGRVIGLNDAAHQIANNFHKDHSHLPTPPS